MDTNLSVWGYYPKDDKPFIDPLYVPYQYKNVATENGVCPVNTWAGMGCYDGMVNPGLVRKDWGWSFQRMFPDKDPCPPGFTEGMDGWCVKEAPEFDPNYGLYSKHAFVPMYQYWNGYGTNEISTELTELDPKSINPFTGNFVVYTKPRPNTNTFKYMKTPSKDSYLA